MRISKFVAVMLAAAAGAFGIERLTHSTPAATVTASAALVQPHPAAPRPEPAPPPPDAPPVTQPAAVSASVSQLRADLAAIVERSTTGAQVGVVAVSLERGDTLFSLNPDVPLAPASNMKVYSTAAALYYLGPEFRFSTFVLGTGSLENGVLNGDLVLYGTGDPSISGRMLGASLRPLQALADTLLARGVREVRGDVVGDGSYFDAEWLGRGWNPDNFGAWYSAPVGALNFGENLTSVEVRPGTVGGPGIISTNPASVGFAVINRTVTTAGGGSSIRFQYEPEGLVVRGQVGRGGRGIERTTPIVDPTNYAAAVFRRVVESRGIRVHGGVRSIYTADESPVTFANRAARNGESQPHPLLLATHLSPTLTELISVTNHVSHNLFAESLIKTVGRVALGEGTFDAGSRAIRYFLECEAGLDTTSIAIVDGSGLSPLNRVTARQTIQVLDVMTRHQHWETFFESLPEAGRPRPRGLNRMLGTPAVGNLRAKTGTIFTVSSLSGYVRSADGEMIAFSILANNLPRSTWAAKRIEDEIGIRLARFERGEARPDEPAAHDTPPADTASTQPTRAAPPAPAASPERAQPARDQRPAASGARTHRVRPGDSFDRIARQYGTTVAALERANPGVNPRRIQPGQTIRIP
jgi:serine-type D-Ala-D-Ala carboxypeptidase/endopeptidase (penicillin-binding protein 4)